MESHNIRFVKFVKTARNYDSIEHTQLDKWTDDEFVRRGMFESLLNLSHVHLYFDFDFHHEDVNISSSVKDLQQTLDELSSVFGEYKYAGYCCDKALYEELGEFAKWIELKSNDLGKSLSFHVVFPNTSISQDELCEIITSGNYKDPFGGLMDVKVYKQSSKEQLLRHPYAHKYEKPNSTSAIELKGVNFNKLTQPPRPSELVATPVGTEPIIEKAQWSTVFEMEMDVDTIFDIISNSNIDQLINETDVPEESLTPEEAAKYLEESVEVDSISLELFEKIYKGFAGLTIHGDVEDVSKEISLFPLMSALYKCIGENVSEDDIADALDFIKENAKLTSSARSKWSEKRKQARKNDDVKTPGTLFIYLKRFNPNYFNSHIRPYLKVEDGVDVKFDLKDMFSIKDIRDKGAKNAYQINGDPEKLDYTAVLNDLKRVMIIVDKGSGVYYFKNPNVRTNTNEFDILKRKDAIDRLKDIKVGTEARGKKKIIETRSAYDIFNSSTNNKTFYRSDVCFFSENPDAVSFFQGYKYQPVQNDELIKPFNDHILNVICRGDTTLYEYLQCWFATIIQNPLAKTTTALVIKGTEGTGKNTMTDVWCELLCGYSNSNADIDAFAGKFNKGVANKKLAVFNEVVSVEIANKALFSILKKLITESLYDMHEKHMNVLANQQNVLNMIFLSNEFNPIMISSTDRRYVVLTPSEKYRNDSAYFKPLYESIKVNGSRTGGYREDFMSALMYYYLNLNVSIDLTKIPDTEERRLLQDTNRPCTHYFIAAHIDELLEGVKVSEGYTLYEDYFRFNGYGIKLTRNKFIGCITQEYCEYVQVKLPDGSRPRCIRLKNNAKALEELRNLRETVDGDESWSYCETTPIASDPNQARKALLDQIKLLQAQLDNIPEKE